MRVSLRVIICQLCSKSLCTEQGKFQASLVSQTVKNLPANAGDLPGFDPWARKIPGERNGNPLHS